MTPSFPVNKEDNVKNTARSQRREVQFISRMRKRLSKMSPSSKCEFTVVRHGETDWNIEFRLQGQLHPGPPLNSRGKQQAQALASSTLLPLSQFDAIYTSDLLRTRETTDIIMMGGSNNSHDDRVKNDMDGCDVSNKNITALPPVYEMHELRERFLGPLQGLTLAEGRLHHPQAYNALISSRKQEKNRKQHDIDDDGGGGGGDVFSHRMDTSLFDTNTAPSKNNDNNDIIESAMSLQNRVGKAFERIATQHQGKKVMIVTHGGVLNALYTYATSEGAPRKASNASISVFCVDCRYKHTPHCDESKSTRMVQTNEEKMPPISNDRRIVEPEWCIVEWSNESHLIENGIGMLSYGGDVVHEDEDSGDGVVVNSCDVVNENKGSGTTPGSDGG